MGMKGHPQNNCSGGGGTGGGGWMMNKKMAMVAVVILVGVMGVMVVQKVKDRRLFNLVIKDKDRQILSLNLLLQKERQYAKENKRKNQDLNAKLYSLRTQKIELNNKIMEMRSTIGSMKDEQRALELAIDEKLNEIKHKESEIKDLKTSIQTPPKIWSTHEVNLTTNEHKPIHQESIKLETLKIEMNNTTNDRPATNGNVLAMKGRRFIIGGSESQRDKSNGENEKSKVKANAEEGPTEVARLKSNRTSGEAEKMDEGETEVDMKEDQDYKEETEV